ncbi:MAG: hypothetical protein LBQ78_00105 [Tannerellaceae bacterium]|nr:hypothetical protein [Tannerellaceae bacterium]
MLEKAYYSTLYEFDAKSKTYRHFYGLLVRKDRQRYRDFLLTKTLLGQLRPLLYNPELLIRIAFALEQQSDQKKVQTMDLVFSMSLAFDFPQKINTLNQYLKTHKLTPCDLTDLKESILMESPDWPKR